MLERRRRDEVLRVRNTWILRHRGGKLAADTRPDEVPAIMEPTAERARVAVVVLPMTDMHLGGRNDEANVRRGIAPVRALLDAGVRTGLSSNNVRNAFTPYGVADVLDVALFLAQTSHLAGPDDLAGLIRMVTDDAAAIVGRDDRRCGVDRRGRRVERDRIRRSVLRFLAKEEVPARGACSSE